MPFVRTSAGTWQLQSPTNVASSSTSDNSSLNISSRSPTPSCQALKRAFSVLYRIEDFTLQPIGSGFFAQIYKAVHIATGDVMVLKSNTQPSNQNNFLHEIQLLNSLSHPNILRFIGVCVSEGHLHALTEFVSGGNLERLIADRSHELSWPVRIRLACDVAKGLKYIHSRGIMHRDLTSKNILVKQHSDGRLSAVVADFGLATRIPTPGQEKQLTVVGSPYWMAPECIMGQPYCEKVDVFSYGIILCELIARVEADPDVLPRTNKFGVDYVAFSKMAADCPLHFLHLTFICCQIEPWKRPRFAELVHSLEAMKYSALMKVILMDLSRLDLSTATPAATTDTAMDREALENILDVKHHKRTRSDEQTVPKCTTPPPAAAAPGVVVTATRRIVPVTPLTVGRVMSRDDAHYMPHAGENPFAACFRDAAVKVVDGFPVTDATVDSTTEDFIPAATEGQMVEQKVVLRDRLQRSKSLPSSPSVSHDDSTWCLHGCTDNSDTSSSVDSAVSLDIGCSCGRRHRCADVVARCLEDCEVLFDSEMSQQLHDDASSFASTLDETALLSPMSSYSSRDDCSDIAQHRFELHSVFWHERFQSLLRCWESRQATVNTALLPTRLRYAVPYLVQFAELRCMWESTVSKQTVCQAQRTSQQ